MKEIIAARMPVKNRDAILTVLYEDGRPAEIYIESPETISDLGWTYERDGAIWLATSRILREKLLASLFTEEGDRFEDEQLMRQMRSMGVNLAAGCYVVIDIAFPLKDALKFGKAAGMREKMKLLVTKECQL